MVERDDGGLAVLEGGAAGEYLIAGWRNQWSDGGNVSSGLPAYLIEQRGSAAGGTVGAGGGADVLSLSDCGDA